jgi:hypothetical protein
MKKPFNFLLSYQFPKTMRINGHPTVFYTAIDNLEGCTKKPGDKMVYAPNDAGSQIWMYMTQLIEEDPKTIFLLGPLVYGYGKSQR